MVIKAISIWQPWASLIADGHKRFETRSWATKYRGPLLICAAKRKLKEGEAGPLTELGLGIDYYIDMSLGVALCVVDLTSIYGTFRVIQVSQLPPMPWLGYQLTPTEMNVEQNLGDFSPGRFAWQFKNVRKLAEPFPVRGRQGVFDVEIPEELRFMK